jgi:hypothetical protein
MWKQLEKGSVTDTVSVCLLANVAQNQALVALQP